MNKKQLIVGWVIRRFTIIGLVFNLIGVILLTFFYAVLPHYDSDYIGYHLALFPKNKNFLYLGFGFIALGFFLQILGEFINCRKQ